MKRFILSSLLAVTSANVYSQGAQRPEGIEIPPPILYKCEPSSFKCVQCEPHEEAGCNYQKACSSSCGKFSPEDLLGNWRGFVVKNGSPTKFPMGEVDITFSNKTATFHNADGSKQEYEVSTTMGDTFSLHPSGGGKALNAVNSLVGNLKYTTVMGISTFGNETYPDSFAQGIESNSTVDWVMFQCNKWGANSTCKFDITEALAKSFLEPKRALIKPLAECAKCNEDSNTCEDCECGKDGCTMPRDQCEEKCLPSGPRYTCDWHETHPKCTEAADGKMSKDQCTNECKPAVYAKCNYSDNTCVKCTPGADDRDCIYLDSYCKTAKEEGRCEQETLSGLWRSIEANIPYNHGEFDIQFRSGKMFIQDYTTMKEAMEVGDIKKTGNAERGGVIFEVMNWKADPKIWPHTQMYGIYEMSYGEQQIFNFLELGFSDKPIHSLEEALHGRYFLGVACTDKKICDFDAASPIPTHIKNLLEYTPARSSKDLFLQ